MVNDKIANFINGLKIANKAGKKTVTVPNTKFIKSVADVLVKEGFIASAEVKEKDKKSELKVELKYNESAPVITDVKRMSHLSKRLYRAVNEIKSVKNGFGIAVLTTPMGVMSNKEARQKNVGGEILFEIW